MRTCYIFTRWVLRLTLCKQYTAKYIKLTFFVILSLNHNENAHLSLDFSLQGFPCTLSFAQLYDCMCITVNQVYVNAVF